MKETMEEFEIIFINQTIDNEIGVMNVQFPYREAAEQAACKICTIIEETQKIGYEIRFKIN